MKSIAEFKAAVAEVEREYRAQLNKLRADLESAQAACKHERASYFVDRAWGNEKSYWECNICGKIL